MILNRFEWTIARRYMLPGRGEAFITLVAGISLVAVMLGVAALVIVMSVMNGFRAELFDKIVGLNGHAIIQAYGGRLDDWQALLKEVEATPGRHPRLAADRAAAARQLQRPGRGDPGARQHAAGHRPAPAEPQVGQPRAAQAGRQQGRDRLASLPRPSAPASATAITIINPAGRATPFGTVPREIAYRVAAIFEIGVYDYDKSFVVMPMQDAQTLLLIGRCDRHDRGHAPTIPTRSRRSSRRSPSGSRAWRW